MFKKLLRTQSNDYAALAARLGAGLVMFPHGAQKALGWFGGAGWAGTTEMMTGMGLPALLVCLIIIAEFFGAISLILGFLTRWSAFWLGVVMIVAGFMHLESGFFMNWFGNQTGEGYEYHILYVALCVVCLIRGGGAWSLDAKLAK